MRIADALKRMAREQPNSKQRHEFINRFRTSVEWDAARSEFLAYLACPEQHLDKRDLQEWKFALDALNTEWLMPREFTHRGMIYYAQGFKWRSEYATKGD